jgi:peptidoglycan/LPS O-acetylase OafA/YrhL
MMYVHNLTKLKSVNFVTWSLEVEVQFYIPAPLLGCLYAICSAVTRRGMIVAFILVSMYVYTLTPHRASRNLPGQLQFFMVGFLVADIRAGSTKSSIQYWWDAISVGAWYLIVVLPSRVSNLVLPVLILLACLSAFNGPITRRVLRTRWIALTGGMCYSFYLMHMLVISTVFKVSQRWIIPNDFTLSAVIQIAVLGPCVYLFCTAYYITIERPCMDPIWPRKVLTKLFRRQTRE